MKSENSELRIEIDRLKARIVELAVPPVDVEVPAPAKSAPAKSPPVEPKTVKARALEWQHVTVDGHPHDAFWQAPYADGLHYRAVPALWHGDKIKSYFTQMDLPPDNPYGWKQCSIGKKTRSLAAAQAVAQVHFEDATALNAAAQEKTK